MKVRIVELLCAGRHCVLATAYESSDGEEIAEMSHRLLESFANHCKTGVLPWCGICGSPVLKPEDTPLNFASMAEAMPFLKQENERWARKRELFAALKGNVRRKEPA